MRKTLIKLRYVNKRRTLCSNYPPEKRGIIVKKHRVFCLKLCKYYKKLKKSKNLQIIIYKLCKLCDNMK